MHDDIRLTAPIVRVRANHSRTQKAGWGHETTVEITGTADAELLARLQELLHAVDDVARAETHRRNRLDAGVETGDD